MNNKTLAQIIQNNIRVKNLEAESGSGGSGEQWEDITNLFTPSSSSSYYNLSKNNLFELIANTPLRITIELLLLSYGVNSISGTIQLHITLKSATILLTNTIYNEDPDSFTGKLLIRGDDIEYRYGINISEVDQRPKILKVERLVQ